MGSIISSRLEEAVGCFNEIFAGESQEGSVKENRLRLSQRKKNGRDEVRKLHRIQIGERFLITLRNLNFLE